MAKSRSITSNISNAEKQSLARALQAARATDIAVAHVHGAGGPSAKDVCEDLGAHLGKQEDYIVLVIKQ